MCAAAGEGMAHGETRRETEERRSETDAAHGASAADVLRAIPPWQRSSGRAELLAFALRTRRAPERDGIWLASAACYGQSPATFFPKSNNPRSEEHRRAYAFCERCPVVEECLLDALAFSDRGGVRGFTLETERRKIRRLLGGPPPYARPPSVDER